MPRHRPEVPIKHESTEPEPKITIAVIDENCYQTTFTIPKCMDLDRIITAYTNQLCRQCTNTRMLEFWYEATMIKFGDTAQSLGMEDGEIIDVYASTEHTSGACPLPPQQKLPNVHYLSEVQSVDYAIVMKEVPKEEVEALTAGHISLVLRDWKGDDFAFRMRKSRTMARPMRDFAQHKGRELGSLRFYIDGERINEQRTPESLELLDEDMLEVHYFSDGG